MAIRWMDGFESYGTLTPDAGLAYKYQRITLTGSNSFVTGRFAGKALDVSGVGFNTPILATHTTWVVGMAFLDKNISDGMSFPLIMTLDGHATQTQLYYTKTG